MTLLGAGCPSGILRRQLNFWTDVVDGSTDFMRFDRIGTEGRPPNKTTVVANV